MINLVRWYVKLFMPTPSYTEQEIRDIIKRDLPEFHLKRRPKKGEKNEQQS